MLINDQMKYSDELKINFVLEEKWKIVGIDNEIK